jgi:hypothetical protein
MTNGRLLAAVLFLLGLVAFAGQITERLPDYFVFVATGCYGVGGALYFLSRPGAQRAEPVASKPAPVRAPSPAWEAPPAPAVQAQHGEVVEVDDPSALDTDAFEVTEDISLPLDVQQERQLTTELEKLRRLYDAGSLTEPEYEKAKARLLD